MLLMEWNPVTKSHWLKWPLRNTLSRSHRTAGTQNGTEQMGGEQHLGASQPSRVPTVTVFPVGALLRGIPPVTKKKSRREMMVVSGESEGGTPTALLQTHISEPVISDLSLRSQCLTTYIFSNHTPSDQAPCWN